MKFQNKIMLSYILFSILVISVFGVFYYRLSVNEYKENEYANMRTVADVKVQQFNDMLNEMERVSTYLLSDREVLEALTSLAVSTESGEGSYADLYFDQATSTVRSTLNQYYLMSRFYRIVVFNRSNVVIANNNYSGTKLNQNVTYQDIGWIDQVTDTKGNEIVIGLHQDDWGAQENPLILSLVTEIQGSDRGYIEVQQTKESIDAFMQNETMNLDYLLYDSDSGELLYASEDALDAEWYQQLIQNDSGVIREIQTQSGKRQIVLEQDLFNQQITMLAVNSADVAGQAILQVLPFTMLMLAGFLALAISYIYITSSQLSKPIKQLQKFMEATRLDNLEQEMPEKISNDEIEILYSSYKDVILRLRDSMIKEKRMSIMQLQAQFDLLQAQVNPHFLYNVLNVISNRGIQDDDEVICDICSDLAGMLRYSTNTKEKYARISDEIKYLEQYMRLLKYRYDYRLTYAIHVENGLADYILPKIVLQQLVENSIVHGYANSTGVIEIEVSCVKTTGGWRIRIRDKGCGMDKTAIQQIHNAIAQIRHKLTSDREHVEMEIGGMGLINTYARLYLLYNDNIEFEIISRPGEGTDMIIHFKGGGEEKQDVQIDYRG